ncbi:MAG: MBL fold metallo-hydrolase [Chloroflexota bacterium]|nr:MBL fold metallo-hydrolase [Chloroflexota bacterium]
MQQISPHIFRFRDSCNVYLIRNGTQATLIDFGTGAILDHLAEIGVERVTDILMTHHHRDQAQGLPRAVAAGIRIWVPEPERGLFDEVDQHWQARQLVNDYDNRQDRFSLLEPVPVTGALQEYVPQEFGGRMVTVVPTPGHTVGSVSILVECDGRRLCFTGDLIAAPGKVWSLAATQWTYNGAEGAAATLLSTRDLLTRQPDVLLPSHGDPMEDPPIAIKLLRENLLQLLELRGEHAALRNYMADPFLPVTRHFLHNRTAHSYSFVLLSKSGKCLMIDYGYDFNAGLATSTDRSARRPWLYSLPRLKEQFAVTSIDVVIPTHYHDDHVAAFNLLRRVEGTEVWAGENMVDVLERPDQQDLPCLWYEPIPVDRSLPLEETITWEEHELTLHPLPGHTLYAVAIEVVVDGKRILAVGDQFVDYPWNYLLADRLPITDEPEPLPPAVIQNYVYRNRFRQADYRETAELYRRVKPDIMVYGHWSPADVNDAHFAELAQRGAELERVHEALLARDDINLGTNDFAARIRPYRPEIAAGSDLTMEVDVRNPFARPEQAVVSMVAPEGWRVRTLTGEPEARLSLDSSETRTVAFCLTPPGGINVRRARVAADVTVGGRAFGQQAEALVTVI